MKKLREIVESVGVCLGLCIVPIFPRWIIVSLARVLGSIGFLLCGKLREIALANLDAALGNSLTREERVRVARDAFGTFALMALDLFWFTAFSAKRIGKWVKIDPSFDHYLNTKPVIAVTGHFGNWEVLGQASALCGAPSVSVAAPLANPFVDRILNSIRRRHGQRIEAKHGVLRKLLKSIRNGGQIALVMDQNTLPSEGGTFVDFFGLPVPVSKSAASLSVRTGAPIVSAFCIPDGRGVYRVSALPPFGPETEECSVEKITQRFTRVMENEIRRNPGKWLWMYKRWKFVPEGSSLEDYPAYARRVGGTG